MLLTTPGGDSAANTLFTYFPAAWLRFGRDADGSDRSLLHAPPFCPLEIWPGTCSSVSATGSAH